MVSQRELQELQENTIYHASADMSNRRRSSRLSIARAPATDPVSNPIDRGAIRESDEESVEAGSVANDDDCNDELEESSAELSDSPRTPPHSRIGHRRRSNINKILSQSSPAADDSPFSLTGSPTQHTVDEAAAAGDPALNSMQKRLDEHAVIASENHESIAYLKREVKQLSNLTTRLEATTCDVEALQKDSTQVNYLFQRLAEHCKGVEGRLVETEEGLGRQNALLSKVQGELIALTQRSADHIATAKKLEKLLQQEATTQKSLRDDLDRLLRHRASLQRVLEAVQEKFVAQQETIDALVQVDEVAKEQLKSLQEDILAAREKDRRELDDVKSDVQDHKQQLAALAAARERDLRAFELRQALSWKRITWIAFMWILSAFLPMRDLITDVSKLLVIAALELAAPWLSKQTALFPALESIHSTAFSHSSFEAKSSVLEACDAGHSNCLASGLDPTKIQMVAEATIALVTLGATLYAMRMLHSLIRVYTKTVLFALLAVWGLYTLASQGEWV